MSNSNLTLADLQNSETSETVPPSKPAASKARMSIPAQKNKLLVFWISAAVISLDQVTKWLVLKNMRRGQSIDLLGDWLKFTFTENPGMAFGIEYGHPALITVFSIVATGLILFYTVRVGYLHGAYQVSLAFVLGGAIGNIIDRVFYGAILYDTPLFVGKVVDFIHVNVWRGTVADGIPFFGGKFVALFPIWNVADMAIVVGVVGILFFQNKFHEKADAMKAIDEDATADSAAMSADAAADDGAATTLP